MVVKRSGHFVPEVRDRAPQAVDARPARYPKPQSTRMEPGAAPLRTCAETHPVTTKAGGPSPSLTRRGCSSHVPWKRRCSLVGRWCPARAAAGTALAAAASSPRATVHRRWLPLDSRLRRRHFTHTPSRSCGTSRASCRSLSWSAAFRESRRLRQWRGRQQHHLHRRQQRRRAPAP
jgi:hypothetical protein